MMSENERVERCAMCPWFIRKSDKQTCDESDCNFEYLPVPDREQEEHAPLEWREFWYPTARIDGGKGKGIRAKIKGRIVRIFLDGWQTRMCDVQVGDDWIGSARTKKGAKQIVQDWLKGLNDGP